MGKSEILCQIPPLVMAGIDKIKSSHVESSKKVPKGPSKRNLSFQDIHKTSAHFSCIGRDCFLAILTVYLHRCLTISLLFFTFFFISRSYHFLDAPPLITTTPISFCSCFLFLSPRIFPFSMIVSVCFNYSLSYIIFFLLFLPQIFSLTCFFLFLLFFLPF